MTKDHLRAMIERTCKSRVRDVRISVAKRTASIDFEDDVSITLAMMTGLAALLQTDKISFVFERGFGGSDATPPDGATGCVCAEDIGVAVMAVLEDSEWR
jgi:hypothetical protein